MRLSRRRRLRAHTNFIGAYPDALSEPAPEAPGGG